MERSPEETGPSDATLGVLFDEIDAVLALLTGLVDQAREAGVLTEPPGRPPGKGRATRQRRATGSSHEPAARPLPPLKIEHGER